MNKLLLNMLLLFAFAGTAMAAVSYPVSTLTVITQEGKADFTVEVATTPEQQEYGLMFRKTLQRDHGMIFEFSKPQHIDMWMKNTLIPLDMLFIDSNGKVAHIVRNAKPESTDIISSEGEAGAVLELSGGAADYYHIAEGDRVVFK